MSPPTPAVFEADGVLEGGGGASGSSSCSSSSATCDVDVDEVRRGSAGGIALAMGGGGGLLLAGVGGALLRGAGGGGGLFPLRCPKARDAAATRPTELAISGFFALIESQMAAF